jgi:hypothetical protein
LKEDLMPFTEDRGRVVRVMFDVVYPTGQMKTLAMNMSDSDWGDTALIAFSEEGVRDIVGPGLEAHLGKGGGEEAVISFMTKENSEAPYKPALLIVRNSGEFRSTCGAHTSTSHMAAGDALVRYL